MNKSIAKKIFIGNFLLVIVTLGSLLIGITFFADEIYLNETNKMIANQSDAIKEAINKGDYNGAIEAIEYSSFRLGATITLFDSSGQILYSTSMKGYNNPYRHHGGRGMGNMPEEKVCEVETTSGRRMLHYKESIGDDTLIIQMPMEKMTDTINAVKRLFVYISAISLLVACVVGWLLSQHFSKPIVELTKLAKDISNLDFRNAYVGTREDEIGTLGNTLNHLSHTLSQHIIRLKDELEKEKSLDKLRSQFIAQVSHELQTPLTIMKGYLEAIQDGLIDDTEELNSYYGIMEDELKGMSSMVRELLDFNQLRSGNLKLNLTEIDIIHLLKEEGKIFADMSAKQNIDFKMNINIDNTIVRGDSKRLQQVIRNLLDNGLKHSDHSLKLYTVADEDSLIINIENSGANIKDHDKEHLWEAFYKAEENDKKGSGLGLAISKAILDSHEFDYGIDNIDGGVKSYIKIRIR